MYESKLDISSKKMKKLEQNYIKEKSVYSDQIDQLQKQLMDRSNVMDKTKSSILNSTFRSELEEQNPFL